MSIYITDLQMTYTEVAIFSNFTRGVGVTYSFDFDDGFSLTGLSSGSTSHFFGYKFTFKTSLYMLILVKFRCYQYSIALSAH